jgi:SdpI/YfhL protein family
MALLLAGLSVPMIRRQVPPDRWYGVRIRRTLNNPDVWYPVNAFVGKRLLVVGLGSAAAAVILYLVPGLKLDTYALACLTVVVVMIVSFVQSVRYLPALGK